MVIQTEERTGEVVREDEEPDAGFEDVLDEDVRIEDIRVGRVVTKEELRSYPGNVRLTEERKRRRLRDSGIGSGDGLDAERAAYYKGLGYF